MSEVERRRVYFDGRVLIESARVLDSPYDDALVCLTGAELELLRNLTTYLHRRSSFVDTYHDGYYIMPDDDDWDAVSAIVATLEEKLMGCEEIAQDIADILTALEALYAATALESANESFTITAGATGSENHKFAAVASGKIRTVYVISAYNQNRAITNGGIQIATGGYTVEFHRQTTTGGYDKLIFKDQVCVLPGEDLTITFNGCNEGDTIRGVMFAADRAEAA